MKTNGALPSNRMTQSQKLIISMTVPNSDRFGPSDREQASGAADLAESQFIMKTNAAIPSNFIAQSENPTISMTVRDSDRFRPSAGGQASDPVELAESELLVNTKRAIASNILTQSENPIISMTVLDSDQFNLSDKLLRSVLIASLQFEGFLESDSFGQTCTLDVSEQANISDRPSSGTLLRTGDHDATLTILSLNMFNSREFQKTTESEKSRDFVHSSVWEPSNGFNMTNTYTPSNGNDSAESSTVLTIALSTALILVVLLAGLIFFVIYRRSETEYGPSDEHEAQVEEGIEEYASEVEVSGDDRHWATQEVETDHDGLFPSEDESYWE
jgi:hypothetical protein